MLLTGIVITIASLALFTEINLLWVLADFLLTGKIPYFDTSIGFIGSIVVLGAVGIMIGRIFYDAKTDLYRGAVENSKSAALVVDTPKISIIDALKDDDETSNENIKEDDLEEVAVA